MKTTTEEVKKMLLDGRHITKLDLFHESDVHSSCLPQRIYDIRQTTDWDIKCQSVKGKGTLREYWLEPEEIMRIKNKGIFKPSNEQKQKDEQLVEKSQNIQKSGATEPKTQKYEQLGMLIGVPSEWW